jgi:hypothetical protein
MKMKNKTLESLKNFYLDLSGDFCSALAGDLGGSVLAGDLGGSVLAGDLGASALAGDFGGSAKVAGDFATKLGDFESWGCALTSV